MNCTQNGWTFLSVRPLLISPMISTPISVPRMLPLPPNSEAPPITTAAIAFSSSPTAAIGCALSSRPASTMPPRPASAPLMT
jgi:hypothetical protein